MIAGADLDGVPAVVRHTHASGGQAWYVATLPPQPVLDDVLTRAAARAGVPSAVPGHPSGGPLPDGVEAVRRGDVLFLLNTSSGERDVALTGTHHDLLTGTDTTGAVRLGPEDAAALIERTS